MLLAELIGVIYYIFAPAFIGIFDDNPQVIAFGVQQARTASLFYFLLAFSHSVAAVCRGAGKAFVPMFIMFSVWCVLRVGYIALVTRLFGEIGCIYWAYPLTWGISSVIYLVYYLFSDWVHGFDPKPRKQREKPAAQMWAAGFSFGAYFAAVHFQLATSGRSTPYLAMNCLCSTSLSFICWMR